MSFLVSTEVESTLTTPEYILARREKARADYWADPEKSRAKNRKTYARHAEKKRAYQIAHKKADPDKYWSRILPYKYGITLEMYNQKMAEQDSKCAICKTQSSTEKRKRLHVDHDHKSGKIRGLLCHHCNLGLGLAKENGATLRALADYLEKHA